MVPIRFSSGIEVSQEQYRHFWGWRYWAERVGLPRGEVKWEVYEEDCVRWFGDVPTMLPPPSEPLEEEEKEGEEDAGNGRATGQGAGGQGGVVWDGRTG